MNSAGLDTNAGLVYGHSIPINFILPLPLSPTAILPQTAPSPPPNHFQHPSSRQQDRKHNHNILLPFYYDP
ncbi:hypothetical protein J1614_003449 [Plenodomus biglobosus]|nr:hypothetical protein J1614_003449 [Plenodomus biglobosus]